MALLTITEQQTIKPISPNWAKDIKVVGGVTNFEQLQKEVENKELANLLGIEMLYDLQQNPAESKYTDLLSGKEFETDNGNTLKFEGIKFQLSYLNFAKYIGLSHIADTFTGFVQKSRNETERISSGDIKTMQTDAREIALNDFNIMRIFMRQNEDIYTLFECTTASKPTVPKFTGIKRTIK